MQQEVKHLNHIEAIKEILEKNGGIVTSKEIREKNIPTIYLTRLVKDNELIRVDRGIYLDPNGDYDEYYFFSQRHQVPIFSYLSSLYLHKFTDIIPQEMEVTVYKGYNNPNFKDYIKVHFVPKDHYELGKTTLETAYGNTVRVYDIERTICDLIKSRNEIDSELFSKTLISYASYKNKNLNKLYEYSKKMNIFEKVKDIVELIYE